jgi:hypothetical protein
MSFTSIKGKYTHVFADHYDYDIAIDTVPEMTAASLKILHRVMRLFLQLSEQYDFCPLVIVEPAEVDVSPNTARPDELDLLARMEHSSGRARDPRRLSRLIEEVSGQVGLPTLSLFDDFKGKPFYYTEKEMPKDDHWNPAGMEEAARLTAVELQRTCRNINRATSIARTQ